jgi:nitroimidazol reductase NimA-like FMN-containing flavoprotein (pyridoxamine 5'-phosphate oxidase superfamily)
MEHKQQLLEYLRSKKLMTVATYSDDVWAASVYYTVDDDFSIYFLSAPESKHVQDLHKNGSVACTIADSRQEAVDKKMGVQLKGIAVEVTGMDRLMPIMDMWHAVNPGLESILSIDTIRGKVIDSIVYKIAPQYIKFFNEELYGPEGCEVFKFA